LATIERTAVPGTNIVPEANIQSYFGGPDCMPTDPKAKKDYSGSRCDIAVRTPGGDNYVVDVTIVDATRNPAPAPTTNYIAGKGIEKAHADKVKQYVKRFPQIDVKTQFRPAAADMRGGISMDTKVYLQGIARREVACNPAIPYSVAASRVFQRFSVSIQRAVAYNAMEYRVWRVPVAVPQALPPPNPQPAAGFVANNAAAAAAAGRSSEGKGAKGRGGRGVVGAGQKVVAAAAALHAGQGQGSASVAGAGVQASATTHASEPLASAPLSHAEPSAPQSAALTASTQGDRREGAGRPAHG
jgi:hypothetical protein